MNKKTFTLAICFCSLIASSAISQNLSIPQTEFSLSTEDSITVEKGSFKKLNVWALRSKQFAGRNIKMGISSSLPSGVVVNFQPQKDYFDLCEATISISPETKPGIYYIIISGTISYKSKGHIVKLTVKEPSEILPRSSDTNETISQ